MKRFHFRLERLERLRRREQRDAAVQLAEATAAVEDCRRRREMLERAENEIHEMWREESRKNSPRAGLLREIAEQLEATRRSIEAAGEREKRALELLVSRREAYLERSRAYRVLEKLREKRWRRWLEQVQREEQRQLDELHLLQTAGGYDPRSVEAKR